MGNIECRVYLVKCAMPTGWCNSENIRFLDMHNRLSTSVKLHIPTAHSERKHLLL